MNRNSSSVSHAIAHMIERVPRQMYEKRGPQEIHPGQWSAMRYLATANASARTAKGLASYLGQTSGPASRAIAALIKKSLVESMPHPEDGRSAILSLTKKGRDLLREDPMQRLEQAIGSLSSNDQEKFARMLETISQSIRNLSERK